MKEYTFIYTVQVTEVVKSDNADIVDVFDKDRLASWIESKLGVVDDVNVKNVKVFERDI